jgi:aspartate aminotransferase-like enzyme/N-acyl-L-homoserine lactone synthetase
MLRVGRYVFKPVQTSDEIEAVHRLNYRTFVRELHQYTDTGDGRLVDKFHDKNTYFIALRDDRVIGMISVHGQPPFSVASRLPDPTILTRPGVRPIEVRLLAVEPEERNSSVAYGLMAVFYEYAHDNGYTDVYISGVQDRAALYEGIGFRVIGPPVPCGAAQFVPMWVSVPKLKEAVHARWERWRRHASRVEERGAKSGARGTGSEERRAGGEGHNGASDNGHALPALRSSLSAPPICLLPGPVTIAARVREAFHRPPIYHRGEEFIDQFETVRRQLSRLVNGRDVVLLNGSGTLANEAIAATLAASGGATTHAGLLLVNGEFGERLARQARRFGLNPRILRWAWGQPWDLEAVAEALATEPPGSWVWGVHQESSTGVLNDLSGLVRLAKARQIRVCADCISSLGAVPLDLTDLYLASGATGKALAAYAGVAIVFADETQLAGLDRERVPSCLDIAAALATRGPRYTFPSPTLQALQAALDAYATPERAAERFREYAERTGFLRRRLREVGLPPLADEACASPVITTFAPPDGEPADAFVQRCQSWGFVIGGQSGYLAERGLVQIACMGDVSIQEMAPLFEHIEQWLRRDHLVEA